MNNRSIPWWQQSQIYDTFSKDIETFSNLSVAIVSQKYLENNYSVSLFLEKQLASQNIFLVKPKLSITMRVFFSSINQHSYNHDRFSKILRSFCGSKNWWIIIVFLDDKSLRFRILSQKISSASPTFQLRSFLKNIEKFLCK